MPTLLPPDRPVPRLPWALSLAVSLALGHGAAEATPAGAGRNLTVSAVAPQAQTEGRRVALVIGNAAYKDAPLTNPVNDARAMAKALEAAGFTVTLRLNTNQRELMGAVRDFGNQLRQGAVGLFYFAGHGMQIKGRNYLIPVGADIEREDEVAYSSLDAQAVLDKMESAGNGSNVMILDACRNNPFARSLRSAAQGLAQMDAPVGTLVAFSTAPGSVASDGHGKHGLYTQHLLDAMRQPGAKLEDVFKQVRAAVRRDSQGKQVPWEATSLEGDFYFHRPLPAPAAPVVAAPAPDVEQWLWDAVQKQPDALGLRAYLQRFPQGRHAADAQAQLKALEATAAQRPLEAAPPPSAPPVVVAAPAPAASPQAAPAAPADAGMMTEAEYQLRLQQGRAQSAWAETAAPARPTLVDGVVTRPTALIAASGVTPPTGAASNDVAELLRQQSGRTSQGWAGADTGTAPQPDAGGAAAAAKRSASGFTVGDSWTYGVRDLLKRGQVAYTLHMTIESILGDSEPTLLLSAAQRLDGQGRVVEVVPSPGARVTYHPHLPIWWRGAVAGEVRDVEFTRTVEHQGPTRYRGKVRFAGAERIEVPAGTYVAQKFELAAWRLRDDGSVSSEGLRIAAWYAPEVGREVAWEQSFTGSSASPERLRGELATVERAGGALLGAR